MVPGLSYGYHTGSLAYPLRPRPLLPMAARYDHAMLSIVLELVHPGNLGALPPSPSFIALKGDQIGVAKYSEFFRR